ncbi:carbohydrate porin [Bradyrhizobium sp. USDA 4454]
MRPRRDQARQIDLACCPRVPIPTFRRDGGGRACVQTRPDLGCRLPHIRHPTWPMRSFEGLLTAVYQYQIRDGWTLQPNLQYIIHPGGGATSPSSAMPGRVLHNATVLGLRMTLKF